MLEMNCSNNGLVKGEVYFFGILEGATLIPHVVKNRQIAPELKDLLLPSLKDSGPLFLESRNFFGRPKQEKGSIFAFQRLQKGKIATSEWKLGLISKVWSDKQFMDVFVWNGPTIQVHDPYSKKKRLYPLFFSNLWIT